MATIVNKPIMVRKCAIGVTKQLVKSLLGSNVNPILEPIIHDFTVTAITDVTMTIQAFVNPNDAETTVSLFHGVTEIPLPNIPSDDTDILVTYTITGLLPYSNYSLRLEATNLGGTTVSNVIIEHTLEPLELTDGNWVSRWDANYEHNVFRHSQNPSLNIIELRDTQFNNGVGDNLLPELSDPSNSRWHLVSGMTLENNKITFNLPTNINGYVTPSETILKTTYRVELEGTFISGMIDVVVGIGSDMIAGKESSATRAPIDGVYNENHTTIYAGNYLYLKGYNAPISGEITSITIKKVLGAHAFHDSANIYNIPQKLEENDYMSFDGVKQRLTCFHIPEIGTVYAIVERDGLDADFVVRNDMVGIGGHDSATGILGIGISAVPHTTFYKVKIKKLWVRSVTDDAVTIDKLNEWINRESHELPETPGILATGVWNDDAVDNDNSFYKDNTQ